MSTPDILLKIIATKHAEVAERKAAGPDVRILARASRETRGFVDALRARVLAREPAVIAEAKKASPSKGVIRPNFDIEEISVSYHAAGAACLSVLTDVSYFKGSDDYLAAAKASMPLPVLRKDFMVDPWQIYESRALGADCILLIVSALTDDELRNFHTLASDLGLDVLIEVHDAEELDRALVLDPTIIGINNRDLRTFETRLDTTWSLLPAIPQDVLVVTESGIHTRYDVEKMLSRGVFAFLVGEAFMRESDPGSKLRALFQL